MASEQTVMDLEFRLIDELIGKMNLLQPQKEREEFVNAIRGLEPVTHTDFVSGLKYMEFTEAVTRSAQSARTVALPL